MKKISKLIMIIIPIICFILSGCSSSSQSLAKNLDTTVTNLVYTVSSLDWADNELIKSFSSPTINNTTAPQQIPNTSNTLITNIPNTQQAEQIYNEQNATYSVPCPHYHPDELIRNQTTEQQLQAYGTTNDYSYNYNMSGNRYPRQRLSRNKISKINASQNNNYQTYSLSNFADNIVYANSETMKNLTSSIEEKSTQIVNSLSTLIEKRANTLLYVNALYNKKIYLNKEAVTAINAYINLIKDNTSYLNSNKGLIANQLSHAEEIRASSQYSPLINAYIIRTSEAIDTRLAKLNSSIEAIDAIIEILDANMTGENIPNSISQNSVKINDKLSTENKIANNEENTTNIAPNIQNNEETLQNNATLNNDISNDNNSATNKSNTTTNETTNSIKPIVNNNNLKNSQNAQETNPNECEKCKNSDNVDFLDNNYSENTKTNKLVPPQKPITIQENNTAEPTSDKIQNTITEEIKPDISNSSDEIKNEINSNNDEIKPEENSVKSINENETRSNNNDSEVSK